MQINSTLWWCLDFKLPAEAQWHKAFQILLRNLQSFPKLIKTTSHLEAYNTDSFSSQYLTVIPQFLVSFVVTTFALAAIFAPTSLSCISCTTPSQRILFKIVLELTFLM